MPLKTVLLFLFEKLGHGRKKLVLNYYETEKVWGEGVLRTLQEEKLLVQAEDAKTIICKGCEKLCDKTIDIRTIPLSCVSLSKKTSDTEKFMYDPGFHCNVHRQWIGVIPRQWEITNQMLIDWLTDYLRLEPPKEANRVGVIQIGTVTLSGEKYALALGTTEDLVLLVNSEAVPIAEIFHFSDGGAIEVNTDAIENHKYNALIKKKKKQSTKVTRDKWIFEKYLEMERDFSHLSVTDIADKIFKMKDEDDKRCVGEKLKTSHSVRRIIVEQKKLSK